jgi:hypothetical protein
MYQLPHQRHPGGTAVHVRDCYVWAEIQYLDSATDYHEYLPSRPNPIPHDAELTFEDERICWKWERLYTLKFVGFLACILLLLVSR